MTDCKHNHTIGSLDSVHWYCKDCGKGLTEGARDNYYQLPNYLIYKFIGETVDKYGRMTIQETANQFLFAEKLMKAMRDL